MIYYYSATGNTRYAVEILRHHISDTATDITDLRKRTEIKEQRLDDELSGTSERNTVGFMFPIYCWGVPPVMMEFMEAQFSKLKSTDYVWFVCTCGDEAGTAMKSLSRKLEKVRGRGADLAMSVIMPNTYVMLPGFDVDKKSIEEEKLAKAPGRLEKIGQIIRERKSGIYEVTEGSLPALRSALFPLFKKWGVNPGLWKAGDNCTGCGLCSKICPAGNIKMERERPEWGKNCYSCCACFHYCPVNAINYGKITRNKSQYYCKKTV